MARVIVSPTTTPMLPPMKPYSIAATTVRRAFDEPGGRDNGVAEAGLPASGGESRDVRLGVSELERVERDELAVVLLELAVVEDARSRSSADSRKWWAHFGQTCRLAARSLL